VRPTKHKVPGRGKQQGLSFIEPRVLQAAGGPLAVVKNGDIISIDIPNRKLTVKLSKKELAQRLKNWTPPPPKVTNGFLALYQRIVGSAAGGARLDGYFETEL